MHAVRSMAYLSSAAVLLLLITAGSLWPQTKRNAPATLTSEQAAADFDQFCREIDGRYAYMSQKHIRWREVRNIYGPPAREARTRLALLHVLEQAIGELYDDHATLGADAPGSPRIVPSHADLWGSWRGGAAVLDEVRPGSASAAAGLRAGDQVLAISGLPITDAV